MSQSNNPDQSHKQQSHDVESLDQRSAEHDTANDAQTRQVEKLVQEYQDRVGAGENLTEEGFANQHIDCREALLQALRRRRLIDEARQKAAARVSREESDPDVRTDSEITVSCPHCHTKLSTAADGELKNLDCSTCGNSFSLVDEKVATRADTSLKSIGHFDLIETVGVGAFGTVWKAYDRDLDRTVALKVPRRGELTSDEQDLFLREARAAANLKHPGIVPVHEIGRDQDSLYIVSDLIRGVPLSDWLATKQMAPKEAAQLCARIAEALAVAHRQGVVHRDLKPANILVEFDENEELVPHVTDFGLARRQAVDITMTVEGRLLGTPAYMSPEQALGKAHEADSSADVYSLGVILYQLLTGELPFRGEAQMLIYQVIHDDPMPPRRLKQSVPRDLETICLKCLEKQKQRRYASATELAEDLGRYLKQVPIEARPVSSISRLFKAIARRPALAGLLFCMIFICFVGVPCLLYLYVDAERNRSTAAEALAKSKAAQRAAESDRELAQSQRQEAEQAQRIAKRQSRIALEMVNSLIVTSSNVLNAIPGTSFARARIWSIAVSKLDELSNQFADQEELSDALVTIYIKVAELIAANQSSAEFTKIAGDTNANHLSAELRLLDRAQELVEARLKHQADDPRSQYKLAEILAGKAQRLASLNRMSEASELSTRTFEIYQRLTKNDRRTYLLSFSIACARVAYFYELNHQFDEAIKSLELALSELEASNSFVIGVDGRNIFTAKADILSQLARVENKAGRQDRAIQLGLEALAQSRLDVGYNRNLVVPLDRKSNVHMELAMLYWKSVRDLSEATTQYQLAVSALDEALRLEPSDVRLKLRRAYCLRGIAKLQYIQDNYAESIAAFEKALDVYLETYRLQTVAREVSPIVETCNLTMIAVTAHGDGRTKERLARKCSSILRILPTTRVDQGDYAATLALVVDALKPSNSWRSIYAVSSKLDRVLRDLIKSEPNNETWLEINERNLPMLGYSAWYSGSTKTSTDAYARAVKELRILRGELKNLADRTTRLLSAWYMLSYIHAWQGQLAEAKLIAKERGDYIASVKNRKTGRLSQAQLTKSLIDQTMLTSTIARISKSLQGKEALIKESNAERVALLLTRARVYHYKGDADALEELAAWMVEANPNSSISLYNAACCFGLAAKVVDRNANSSAAQRTAAVTRLVKKSIDFLQQSMDMGFVDFNLLERDSDLITVRRHTAFKTWRQQNLLLRSPVAPPLPEN